MAGNGSDDIFAPNVAESIIIRLASATRDQALHLVCYNEPAST